MAIEREADSTEDGVLVFIFYFLVVGQKWRIDLWPRWGKERLGQIERVT